jgi:hypothetical protein
MQTIGKRIAIAPGEIQISTPKNIFMLLFMPIWLTGWTIGGGVAMWQVISGQGKETWFLLVWLCGWLAGELFMLYAFLWSTFGKELITTEHGTINIKRSIFRYGLSKQYQTTKMSNLRASGFFATMMSWNYSMAYWGLTGGTVAFDYENKSVRFGINLNEDDANELVKTMKSRFNL